MADLNENGMGVLAQPDSVGQPNFVGQPTANAPVDAQPTTSSPIQGDLQQPAAGPAQPAPAANFGRNPLLAFKMIGSGAVRMGRNLGTDVAHALDTMPVSGKPGSWARSVVAAGQKALAGIGDIDTTPSEKNGAGAFLEGFARTAANTRAREAKEQQTKFGQDVETQKLQLDKDRTASEIAMNQMQMYHTQLMIHQAGEQAIKDDIAYDQPRYQETLAEGGSDVMKDVSGAELVKAGFNPNNPEQSVLGQNYVIFHTGRRSQGKDKDGAEKNESTYTVVKAPTDHKVSDDEAALYKSTGKTDSDLAGKTMPFAAWHSLDTQARAAQSVKVATVESINKLAGAEAAGKVTQLKLRPEFSSAVQDAISSAMKDSPIKGTFSPEVAISKIMSSPAVKGSEQYVRDAFIQSLGGDDQYKEITASYNGALKDKLGADRANQILDRQEKQQQGTAYSRAEGLIKSAVQSRNALATPTRKIDAANQAARLMADSYNPKTKQFDINSMNYNELSGSVAQLLTAGNMATQEQINGIKADTAYGRLQQMMQFWSGAPKNAAPQDMLKFLQRTIDREADEAEKTRSADWDGFIVPQINDDPVLSDDNKHKILQDMEGSGLRKYESIESRVKGMDNKPSLPDDLPQGVLIVKDKKNPDVSWYVDPTSRKAIRKVGTGAGGSF